MEPGAIRFPSSRDPALSSSSSIVAHRANGALTCSFTHKDVESDRFPGARSRRNDCDLVTKFRHASVEGVCDFVRVWSAHNREMRITGCQCLFLRWCAQEVCVCER